MGCVDRPDTHTGNPMNLTTQQRVALGGLIKVVFALGMLCLVWLILAQSACSQREEVAQSTPRIYSSDEAHLLMPGAICGDSSYAEVNSAWLRDYYDQFRAEIFRHGVTKWDERFDCNHFAGYYVALAQTKFYLENFHSRTKANSLAVGSYWYISKQGPHAVVFALTERGTVWIEPQNGREFIPDPSEQSTAFLKLL